MKTKYSKPSSDIALETADWIQRDQETYARQTLVAKRLENAQLRTQCLLCASNINDASAYRHRQTDFISCSCCGHLQSRVQLPTGYPYAFIGAGFEAIYPKLDNLSFASRRDRIYKPKLDWVLSNIEAMGKSQNEILQMSWLEIGCGAGYFLDALRVKGAKNVHGLDENAELIAIAKENCGEQCADISEDMITDVLDADIDIVAAFFVLEHIEESNQFWSVMAEKKAGTMFFFAVPTFGISTVLEGAVDGFAARNLDGVIHSQLYTDRSIDYALSIAGYEKVAEWLFGQDASDLCRLLINRIAAVSDETLSRELAENMSKLIDPLQHAIDRARLCDARHVLAVKR